MSHAIQYFQPELAAQGLEAGVLVHCLAQGVSRPAASDRRVEAWESSMAVGGAGLRRAG